MLFLVIKIAQKNVPIFIPVSLSFGGGDGEWKPLRRNELFSIVRYRGKCFGYLTLKLKICTFKQNCNTVQRPKIESISGSFGISITVWSNEVSVWLAKKARKIYLKKPLASKIRICYKCILWWDLLCLKDTLSKRTGVKGTELSIYSVCAELSWTYT